MSFPGTDALQIEYADGRILQVPLVWSARLSKATPTQRANVRILDDGRILSWPDVDEDISAEALLTADELIDWPLEVTARRKTLLPED
ncbi:MAG: DUF2442 domain-containing protein [Desulforudis sp.]|nr:MAG: DUF2442 domain-containing protein [Desulforudis sp.]